MDPYCRRRRAKDFNQNASSRTPSSQSIRGVCIIYCCDNAASARAVTYPFKHSGSAETYCTLTKGQHTASNEGTANHPYIHVSSPALLPPPGISAQPAPHGSFRVRMTLPPDVVGAGAKSLSGSREYLSWGGRPTQTRYHEKQDPLALCILRLHLSAAAPRTSRRIHEPHCGGGIPPCDNM